MRRNKTNVSLGISNQIYSVRMSFSKIADEGHLVTVYCCHAEQAALRAAKPGDTLWIYRWTKSGLKKDSKPCNGCMALIKRHYISRIYYFKNGELIRENI